MQAVKLITTLVADSQSESSLLLQERYNDARKLVAASTNIGTSATSTL